MKYSIYLNSEDVKHAILEYVENHYTDQFHEGEVDFTIVFDVNSCGEFENFKGITVEKECD